jgi:hypothetical protein
LNGAGGSTLPCLCLAKQCIASKKDSACIHYNVMTANYYEGLLLARNVTGRLDGSDWTQSDMAKKWRRTDAGRP